MQSCGKRSSALRAQLSDPAVYTVLGSVQGQFSTKTKGPHGKDSTHCRSYLTEAETLLLVRMSELTLDPIVLKNEKRGSASFSSGVAIIRFSLRWTRQVKLENLTQDQEFAFEASTGMKMQGSWHLPCRLNWVCQAMRFVLNSQLFCLVNSQLIRNHMAFSATLDRMLAMNALLSSAAWTSTFKKFHKRMYCVHRPDVKWCERWDEEETVCKRFSPAWTATYFPVLKVI